MALDFRVEVLLSGFVALAVGVCEGLGFFRVQGVGFRFVWVAALRALAAKYLSQFEF